MRRLLLLVPFALYGCATLTKGTSQAVALNTPGAPGAHCQLYSPAVGQHVVVTPATLTLSKSHESIRVHCKKQCFQDGVGIIQASVEEMVAGNILVGGVVGLGVDAASGAMNKYSPETNIVMASIPGCRSSGPEPAISFPRVSPPAAKQAERVGGERPPRVERDPTEVSERVREDRARRALVEDPNAMCWTHIGSIRECSNSNSTGRRAN